MTGKKKIIKILFISLFLLININNDLYINAEEPNIILDIDDTNIELGVSTNLTIIMEDIKGAEVKSIDGLENFEVLSTRQSSSTKIINGNYSNQKLMTYTILPKMAGDFELIAHIEYKGKIFDTNKISIHVKENNNNINKKAEDIFITTKISKDNVYFGEKVILTYELYSRYNIEDYGFIENVKFDKFIAKDIPKEKLKANYMTINGKKYIKYEVKKVILSPTETGEFHIPSYNFQVNISTGDFFSSSKPVYFKTEEKMINVKHLPDKNKPSNFSGLVGKLELESNYSDTSVNYGDSLSLNVSLSGNINLDIIDKLELEVPENITKYETSKDLIEDVIGDEYYSKKDFEIILIPKTTGNITINPISINYFDVETGEYKELTIPKKILNVTGDNKNIKNNNIIDDNNTESNNNKITINQVSYNKHEDEYFIIKKEIVYTSIIAIISLIIIIIIFFITKQKYNKNKDLRNIYKKIKKAKDENDCYNILNEMIKYKYNISLKALNQEEIAKIIDNELILNQIFTIMNYIENKFYNKNNTKINCKEIINKIYKQLIRVKESTI